MINLKSFHEKNYAGQYSTNRKLLSVTIVKKLPFGIYQCRYRFTINPAPIFTSLPYEFDPY